MAATQAKANCFMASSQYEADQRLQVTDRTSDHAPETADSVSERRSPVERRRSAAGLFEHWARQEGIERRARRALRRTFWRSWLRPFCRPS
jgi:hypothetical protein